MRTHELGLESSVPDPVPDDDPKSKVDGKGDQSGKEGEEGGERHEDGASPRRERDSELEITIRRESDQRSLYEYGGKYGLYSRDPR